MSLMNPDLAEKLRPKSPEEKPKKLPPIRTLFTKGQEQEQARQKH